MRGGKSLSIDLPSQAVWYSDPVTVNFTGWRQLVFPKSKFTLRLPADSRSPSDLAVPPDAQYTQKPSPAEEPVWGDAGAVTLETTSYYTARLIVDDLAWVTLNDKGDVVSDTSIDDFETGDVGAWTSLGTRAQRDCLAFKMQMNPSAAHGGRVAFNLSITPPSIRRRTLLLPSVNRTLAVSHKPYLVFTPASLFDPVISSTLPEAIGATSEIDMSACPEQIQAGTFCLYSRKALTDVSATLSDDFQGIGHVLSKDAASLYVVKVWQQAGAGAFRDPDTAGPVGELLVKDDRIPLTGTAPAIPLTGNPVTNIAADSTKQFWITLNVPKNTPPGEYIGNIVVTSHELSPFPVLVRLNVLPLRLLGAEQQYAINLRSRLDTPPPVLPSEDGKDLVTDFVTKDNLIKQLADITDHGFHIVTLHDSPATLWDAVDLYKSMHLAEPYIYQGNGDPTVIEADRKARSEPAFLYAIDPGPITATSAKLAQRAKAGILSTTYIANSQAYDALQDNLELPIYNRDSDYPQHLLQTHGERTSSKRDWWYWPAGNEDAHANRYSAGYLLWRTNLYGAYVPIYQLAFGTDPYDEKSRGADPAHASFRPEMLTYPAQDGVIDTIQWEAIREGVTDARYLTTFYSALRECKDDHIAKPLVIESESYVKAFIDKPLALLPDGEYDKARAKIANYAIALRAKINAYDKTVKSAEATP